MHLQNSTSFANLPLDLRRKASIAVVIGSAALPSRIIRPPARGLAAVQRPDRPVF